MLTGLLLIGFQGVKLFLPKYWKYYLPLKKHLQLLWYKVCLKIQKERNTKSTLEIDIPDKLRKEAAAFIAEPLTHNI